MVQTLVGLMYESVQRNYVDFVISGVLKDGEICKKATNEVIDG